MSKVTNMAIFFGIFVLIFNLVITKESSAAGLVGFLLHPELILTSSYWDVLKAATKLVTAAGVIIGFFAGSKIGLIVKAGIITSILFTMVTEFVGFYSIISTALGGYIALIIISPMALTFLIAVIEWWQ